MRSAGANFLSLLIGICCAVLLGEIILQGHYRYRHGAWLFGRKDTFVIDYIVAAPDRREYTLKPGYSTKELSINMDGFRGWPICPKDPSPLVCVLGDSVPFGIGVRDQETYPFLLQAELRKTGDRINVLNAGVPSYCLRQAFERFQSEISPIYRPALIIIQTANDVMLVTHYREKWTPEKTWSTVRMKGGRNYSRAAAKIAFYNYLTGALGNLPDREKEFHRQWTPERMIDGIRETLRKQLARFSRLHIPVILLPNDPFYYPGPDMERNRKLKRWREFAFYHRIWNQLVDDYNRVLQQAADPARGVYFFDSRPLMDARGREALYADFIHLSPAGNALLAEALAEFIRQTKLLPAQAKEKGSG